MENLFFIVCRLIVIILGAIASYRLGKSYAATFDRNKSFTIPYVTADLVTLCVAPIIIIKRMPFMSLHQLYIIIFFVLGDVFFLFGFFYNMYVFKKSNKNNNEVTNND